GGPGKGRRLLLAPRRHYSTLAALSNHGHDPSTACKIGLIATNRTAGAVADPPPLRTLKLCVGIFSGNLGKFPQARMPQCDWAHIRICLRHPGDDPSAV